MVLADTSVWIRFLANRAPCAAGLDHLLDRSVRSGRHLHGLGIGWIDAQLLASAIVSEAALWTADARLAEVASAMGVGYRPFAN